jgi:nucleoredoxin
MLRPAATLALLFTLAAAASAKVETWTDLDGRTMEAEFVSASDTHFSFRKADGVRYIFPVAQLSETDQARARELAGQNPAPAPSAAASAPATPAPAAPGKFTSEIAGKLVSLKGRTLSPAAGTPAPGTKYYALYFSAQWCPPCRAFTPELVAAYKTLKSRHPDFELVFISNDEDTEAMKTYMSEYKMPWPALRHEIGGSLPAVQRYNGRGIPHLVFITADGEVLSTSYVDGQYVGPRKVLADIKKTLAGKS